MGHVPVQYTRKGHRAGFGVLPGAVPICVTELRKKRCPALVKPLEDEQRRADVGISAVGEGGPGILVVRFEGRVVLGQDEPTPRKCCAVRISQMMHVLGDAPLAGNGGGTKCMLIDARDDCV